MACNNAIDGLCNTDSIVTYYSQLMATSALESSSYAAELCYTKMSHVKAWYLPSICEMGPNLDNQICNSNKVEQNIVNHLSFLFSHSCIGSSCLSGYYWSSTESSAYLLDSAWTQLFLPEEGSSQSYANHASHHHVRCARTFS